MLTRQKISTIKDKGLRLRLEELLNQVTRAMRAVNFTGEFYIAGGSVSDIMTKTKTHSDVDVFVYDEDAFYEAKEKFEGFAHQDLHNPKHDIRGTAPLGVYETGTYLIVGNALQTRRAIQINRVHIDPPEDVFKKFDLVNSMVAITSTGELVKHKDFSSRIRVNLDAMSNFTLGRYFRYLIAKGALDPDEAALRKIIDYVIDNPFKGLGYCDTGHSTCDAINSLATNAWRQRGRASMRDHSQYIHDRIVEKHSGEDRIPIFERLVTYGDFNVDKPCTELALVNIINLREYIDGDTLRDGWKETYHDVINKYPEYFI
jgi:hypothetical protein